MKKITAIALAVVMALLSLNLALPVFAEDVSTAAALHEAMSNDEDVTLTADVDLTGYDWTIISKYTKTLDGNGHTINLGTQDDPFIGSLYGTVKDLNLTGTMNPDSLDDATIIDPSTYTAGYKALGVLANNAIGATIENVDVDVNVAFNFSNSAVNVAFGSLVGLAMSEYNTEKTELVAHTNIVNCQTSGTINIANNGKDGGIGGIVGRSYSNTTIEKCASYIEMTTKNYNAHFGGIVGNVDAQAYTEFLGDVVKSDNVAGYTSRYDSVNIEKCIFAGSVNGETNINQAGGIVGYCQTSGALNITSCVFSGNITNGRDSAHIFGYSKLNKNWLIDANGINITGCAVVGKVFNGTSETYRVSNNNNSATSDKLVCKDNYIMGNHTFVGPCQVGSNQTFTTVDEVKAAFVAANPCDFAIEDDEVVIIRDDSAHKYEVNNNNTLSAGVCSKCEDKSDADYAGFIQFATASNKVRFVMVISEDEIDAADFTMTITINETKKLVLDESALSTYESVSAEDDTYTAADGYQIFGVIVEMGSGVEFEKATVEIVSGGTELYTASTPVASN